MDNFFTRDAIATRNFFAVDVDQDLKKFVLMVEFSVGEKT